MKPSVLLYLAADALSLLGNIVAGVVMPLLVLARTGDATAAGTVAAVTALPALVAAVLGGVVADRVDRRRLSIFADLASAASVAALPVVDAVFGLNLGWFVVLGLAGALFDVPGMTARETLWPAVAARAGMPLERLAGVKEGLSALVLVVGPGAGALLVAMVDEASVLWVTAACSALAALFTAAQPKDLSGERPSPTPGGVLADLREGFDVLRRDAVIGGLTLLSLLFVLVLAPFQELVLPVHLTRTGAPEQFGLVVLAMTLGTLLGNGVYAALGARISRWGWFVGCNVLTVAGLVWLTTLPSLWWLLAAGFLTGAAAGPMQPLLSVLSVERVPDAARGRVMGLQNAGVLAASPIGLLAAGLLIERYGVRPTGTLIAGGLVLITVATLCWPALRRQLRERPEAAPSAPDADAREVAVADDR
ncbi:putative arabinose efflux permease, MFS family [Streptoalloteichus tenebrarius]|uniref:Multidrug efflux pump Tap n=1 Tax=Streptoalloteichus tenebrarius (strain ATCC 17920 / DSM 40477 / JCM 4838 / CBS 697.72 / NBRC 16177 / NCIMB 11028 / NRRL B-12390 / A12253. 1 / ISP 5477) TaxID=1933 RepID=A0ABT1I3I8_STRSD|nr:MFS transporter [Streptoalloteichus tenebrarius]MCP2262298.1 putative arabinose efflux permease, MFS family [Streptoalloteichus tenebrarius]BFF01810.1 MFS transporter [Streptoalloteichus tenebrarius]